MTHTCARCGQLYDPQSVHVCSETLDGLSMTAKDAIVGAVLMELDDYLAKVEAERDALRAEVAQLDAICWWNREHVATVVDEEFGLRIGGPDCEHPSLTGDRCDACGWKRDES